MRASMWRLLLRRVHTRHSARVNPLQATLHRDSILLVIVDSGRRVLVLVASILIGGAGLLVMGGIFSAIVF